MTGGDRRSRSWPSDDAGPSDDATVDETDDDDETGDDEADQDPGLLEQVADAVGNLWDDEPDGPEEA